MDKHDARLLVDALFLVVRLTSLMVDIDKAGKLYKDHKVFRITQKARNRFRRIRSSLSKEE